MRILYPVNLRILFALLLIFSVNTIGSTYAFVSQSTSGAPCSRGSVLTLQDSAIKQVHPARPFMAKLLGIKGHVIVEVTVDEQGDVVAARALTGPSLLRKSAVRAARGWKFKPAMLNGKPVKIIGPITMEFPSKR